jgi:hypothetical protein
MATDQQTIQSNPAITASTEKDILDDEKDSLPALTRKRFKWIVIGTILSLPIYVTLTILLIKSWSDRSNFGEMFGGLNTLFSGLAFIGVIYAILLQRKELQYQRRELRFQRLELELTRNELKRSAEAQEKSEQALKDQVAELVNQRRLSILPGFILFYKHPADNRPTIKNIGTGVALNVAIKAAEIETRLGIYCNNFNLHSFILPNEEKQCMILHNSLGFKDESWIYMEQDAWQYLRDGDREVTILFNDLEGNKYSQQINLFNGLCQPQKVKLEN